ncbi:hypothetical protein [Asanoa iriomotensis]|uniref:Uncharacterized protein n=1 Tax=Asanoa iriomotensis TaxID=234613 RepID=A0ABQ4C7U7_9ACTN|nr:hypothetical protein [Asanoa iriomotensis]GIF58814.1 hypothetical protein Air01nite_49090 [Asanoa iriomotensis]
MTSLWDLFRRKVKLPADAGVALDPDERVIAWSRTQAGPYVVATDRGLRLPHHDRLDWHRIHKAVWSGRELTVTPAEVVEEREGYEVLADAPSVGVLLVDPREVPQQVRARVTGSVSYTSHHPVDGGGVRVVARKVRGRDGLAWSVRYDPGTETSTPDVVEATSELVADARLATTPKDL